jgi:hypothetical protein
MSTPKPRLPAGSSLVDCVRRLARLETTNEMRPRHQHPDARELALDQLILTARRVLR